MNRRLLIAVLVPSLLLLLTSSSRAEGRPRVGLALSGGSARGFAHIGVIKVLEEAGMPIDVVTGTSMGAIMGGLYAAGYSSAQIESLAVCIDWYDLFSDALPRSELPMEHKRWNARYAFTVPMDGWLPTLPSGLVAGQKITKLLSRLTLRAHAIEDFTLLPIAYACVATDIETGEAVVLRSGNIAEAMRASMAIPSVFTPVELDGRLLVDGGVARNLPAVDARDLGADIVIGVYVGAPLYKQDELTSMVRIMDQTASFQIAAASREQQKLCDVLITPDVHDAQGFQFDNAPYFIARGEEAARKVLPRLRALADSVRALSGAAREQQKPHGPDEPDTVLVTEVVTEGLQRIPPRVVETELKVKPPVRMTPADIEAIVDRVYKYDYFERVSYRLEPSGDGSRMVLKAVEKSQNLYRLGLRYDSETSVSLLLNTTLRNLGLSGSALALDVRAGEDTAGDLRYFAPAGRTMQSFGFRARANVSRTSLSVLEGDVRVAEFRTTYTFGELLFGNIFSSRLSVTAGARAEYVRNHKNIGPEDIDDSDDRLLPVVAELRVDTFDRTMFPRWGVFLQFVAEATSSHAGSDMSFTRYYGDWRVRIPLHRRVSLLQWLYAGTTATGDSPPVYQFTVGGLDVPYAYLGESNDFLGLDRRERAGPHAQALGVGVQWELRDRMFMIARWNVGNTFSEWNEDLDWDRYLSGGGLTFALDLPVAPIEFTIMSGSGHDLMSQLSIGYDF